ncbi:uncharacterized protein ACLA_082670 [Aspergillus clavatus NRRL 1]|uniref:Alpha/beta hydrolase fold-3 domain-containing protein n=1 Tax=Aspergillus clavatus (strain ATCC 1007 / CBS 513.65 / DSM 816 / NCTC 3887 / NRRL 1 / QM 1276 / 107) TaxID=344612 RepID=A1CTD9_ASPCL|nr:uncharacterized protein ACLA_082670 [Aspergillus clavatus NRRL 1]EAW06576.1 conserved hypothetical protein [Aspergillus clavatus NRRL 1]
MRQLAIRSLDGSVLASFTPAKYSLIRFQLRASFPRSFSSSRSTASTTTTTNQSFQVPVGNNGHVSLNVVHASSSTVPNRANVIIHLPPGPVFRNDDKPQTHTYDTSLSPAGNEDAKVADALASATSSTVVTINYRLGAVPTSNNQSVYRYPTPVHDTLAGYDWVLRNLQPGRIGVIGTHVGGSLGLMLALTEAQSIRAVAAIEPICDWTGLDEYCDLTGNDPLEQESITTKKPRGRSRALAPPDLVPLLEARERFFTTPERYFDAFASPVLFLRSPGKDVPKIIPRYQTGPEYPIPVLLHKKRPGGSIEDLDINTLQSDIYDFSTTPSDRNSDPEFAVEANIENERRPIRRRKALHRWPPYGLDYGVSGSSYSRAYNQGIKRLEVALPRINIFVGDDKNERGDPTPAPDEKRPTSRSTRKLQRRPVLVDQANEMVDVMRKACFWGREKGFGESRVTLSQMRFDAGAISNTTDAGKWMGDALADEK